MFAFGDSTYAETLKGVYDVGLGLGFGGLCGVGLRCGGLECPGSCVGCFVWGSVGTRWVGGCGGGEIIPFWGAGECNGWCICGVYIIRVFQACPSAC